MNRSIDRVGFDKPEDYATSFFNTTRDTSTTKWKKRCPAVVESLDEAGDELLTFYRFPESQWKGLRTTNIVERVIEEFRRRVKTQAVLPSEDSALLLLYGLAASGQLRFRKLDGYQELDQVGQVAA